MKPHYFMKPLIAINVFIIVTSSFLMPLWAKFVMHIGGDLRTACIAICVFSIVIGIFTIIASRIEHSFRHYENFIAITSLLFTLTYCGYFFVSHPWQLYLIQVILGLCGAFQCPALFALYHFYMPKTHSGFHWGIWNGFYNISVGVGALMSAYIAYHFGFTAVFATLVGFSLVGNIYTIFAMHQMKNFRRQVSFEEITN